MNYFLALLEVVHLTLSMSGGVGLVLWYTVV
jgi:hypothetical protein